MTEATSTAPFDLPALRAEFPILSREVYDKPLVYLDNAATVQKPQCVIDAITHYYTHLNSNVHRGVHRLSQEATEAYEGVRDKVRELLNAPPGDGIIFVRGTTEALNLVAHSWGGANLTAGDEILISAMEHHSNIVPWQLVAEHTGAVIRVLPMDDSGQLLLDELDAALTGGKVKVVAVNHVSNALGTVNPITEITRRAHEHGAIVVVDGAQAVPHMPVDVQALDADFYAFSAHKVFGPTGVGVLWGKTELLDGMPPWQGGGDMIRSVSFEGSTWNRLPYKFEAGTPNIADVIALGTAIEWFTTFGIEKAAAWEQHLLRRATEAVSGMKEVRIIGTAPEKAAVLSFVMDGAHPHDVGTILDREGIAIRTGHHCAEPVLKHFGVPATARASFAVYNTEEEVDAFVQGLDKARKLFA